MRRLQSSLAERDDVQLIIVAQKEPHVSRMAFRDIAQPQTLEERCDLASRMVAELELNIPVLVDDMDDRSRELFSDLPSPAFVIGPDGTVAAKLPWADEPQISRVLTEQLATSPVGAETP